MTKDAKVLRAFKKWYEELGLQRDGFPARGTLAAALVVLERLRETPNLQLEAHRAKSGQSQIKGLGRSAVAKILARYGETRPFLREGGRTNRGAPGEIGRMLQSLESQDFAQFSLSERSTIVDSLQGFLVEKVRDFHNRKRLKMTFEPKKTTHSLIQDLLALADLTGKSGQVAQHLVGAKLQMRFPRLKVEQRPYSAADEQLGRPGDFAVGDTAFHVTVSPAPALFERCRENIEQGRHVYVLVAEKHLMGARQNAEMASPEKRIVVEAIESFVSQNIDELSEFSEGKLAEELRRLLEEYNRRVNETESDKSLMIEIPSSLLRKP